MTLLTSHSKHPKKRTMVCTANRSGVFKMISNTSQQPKSLQIHDHFHGVHVHSATGKRETNNFRRKVLRGATPKRPLKWRHQNTSRDSILDGSHGKLQIEQIEQIVNFKAQDVVYVFPMISLARPKSVTFICLGLVPKNRKTWKHHNAQIICKS